MDAASAAGCHNIKVAPGLERFIDEDSTLLHTIGAAKRAFNIVIMLTLGWPLYLIVNATGRKVRLLAHSIA